MPKSGMQTTRPVLGAAIQGTVADRLRGGILLVMPGHPSFHLFQIGIDPLHHDLTQCASVFVRFATLNFYLMAKHQAGEVLFRALTKGLGLFRRINPG